MAEATAELARLGEGARVYAGGAEILLLMRHGIVDADYLVDIKPITALGSLAWEDGTVRIGPTVTHRRLELDPMVRERLPMLADAEAHVGNVRVRGQGTLGGNLCFADPHADPPTAILVYDALVSIAGPNGERQLPLADFLVGTYETALEPGEVLTEVRVRPLPEGWGSAFGRIERFYRPTANVAAAASLPDGRLDGVRLAVGCVGPRAVRLAELEHELQGTSVDEAERRIANARPYLSELLEPVDDLLGSAEYKVAVTTVLLGRALREAAAMSGRAADA